jgi:hypothetical protein
MSSKRQITGNVFETKGTVIIVCVREKQTNGKHSQKARSYGRAAVKRCNA